MTIPHLPARRARAGARIASCLAAALLAAPSAALAQRLADVDALVAPHVGSDTPGLAVLVAEDGVVRHLAGYGVADIESQEPVTPDTLFDLASVSKQMTALAAALLVEDGTLDPTAPVADVLTMLPALPEGASRAILLEDLVRHTSGLPDYLGDAPGLGFDETTTNGDVLAWVAGMPLDAEPGTVFAYSNTGYLVLGALVAAADGVESLDAVLHARVFEPLGMTSSASGYPRDEARRASGHAGTDGAFEASGWDTSVEGDGSIWTSLADLARYEAALAEGFAPGELLVSQGAFDDGERIADESGAGYGWGWSLYTDDFDRTVAAHGGSWYGTAAYYYRGLDTGVSVVVLANGEDLDAESLAWEIARALEE
ncbi:serine hydrolase domain-containing protein [Salinarimonas chemoclinalis]|uniref:serine hydrolase domain-containing protein n=1 Tax=Salinarimonas chemoclinalis TaxID=3241599 RepID=UPI00355803B1